MGYAYIKNSFGNSKEIRITTLERKPHLVGRELHLSGKKRVKI
jgi:hypothetical protein